MTQLIRRGTPLDDYLQTFGVKNEEPVEDVAPVSEKQCVPKQASIDIMIEEYMKEYAGEIFGNDYASDYVGYSILADCTKQADIFIGTILVLVTLGITGLALPSFPIVVLFFTCAICVLFKHQLRQTRLSNMKIQHEVNQKHIGTLFASIQGYVATIEKHKKLITEVELIAKGHTIMIPHAPISRIEIQKSHVSFHSQHLRKILVESLEKVVDSLFIFCKRDLKLSCKRLAQEHVPNLSIAKIKEYVNLILDMRDMIKESFLETNLQRQKQMFLNLHMCRDVNLVLEKEMQLLRTILDEYRYDDMSNRASMISFISENNKCRSELLLSLDDLHARIHLLSELCNRHVHEDKLDTEEIDDQMKAFLENLKNTETQFRCLYGNLIATHIKKHEHTNCVVVEEQETNIEEQVVCEPESRVISYEENASNDSVIDDAEDTQDVTNVYTIVRATNVQPPTKEITKPMFGLPPLPQSLRSKLIQPTTIIQQDHSSPILETSIEPPDIIESRMLAELKRVMKSRGPKQEKIVTQIS